MGVVRVARSKTVSDYETHTGNFNYSRIDSLLCSFENCTKKLDSLIEKTAIIEQNTANIKRKR